MGWFYVMHAVQHFLINLEIELIEYPPNQSIIREPSSLISTCLRRLVKHSGVLYRAYALLLYALRVLLRLARHFAGLL